MRKKRPGKPVSNQIKDPEPVQKIRKKRKINKPKINIGKLISDYLMHSYLYYEKNESIISDQEFDGIVHELIKNFDEVEKSEHIHKHLIDIQALKSYTGFSLIGRFPNQVKIPALEMLMPEKKINELIKEL